MLVGRATLAQNPTMNTGLVVGIGMALAFTFTNGVHDAANAIATLVATRAARPGPRWPWLWLAISSGRSFWHRGGGHHRRYRHRLPRDGVIPVLGATLTGAVAWNGDASSRGLPSSSGHALLGGLVGVALATGGTGAVNWGGFDGISPVGVAGRPVVLTDRPMLDFVAGLLVDRGARRTVRHARRESWALPAGQWMMSEGSHSPMAANDASKGGRRASAAARRGR